MDPSQDSKKQIQDAVRDFLESDDFKSIRVATGQALDVAHRAVGEGLSQASDALSQMQERQRAEQERRALQVRREEEQRALRQRYRSAGTVRAVGWIMAVLGALYGLVSTIAALGLASESEWAATAVAAILAGLFWWLFSSGAKRIKAAGLYDGYRRALGPRQWVTVRELAQQTGRSEKQTADTVRFLLDKGLFREGCLDEQAGVLLVTSEAYRQHLAARDAYEAQRRASLSAQEKQRALEREKAASSPAAKAEGKDLPPRVRELVDRGTSYLDELGRLNDAIDDASVSEKIDSIELVVGKIFEQAVAQPDVIDDLGKLMDYYLPTTVKLLKAYEELEEQPYQGENIAASRKEIEGSLDTLSTAYKRLLDSTFEDMAWDVSTDISVLNAVLAQEGLVDDAFSKTKNKEQ